MIYLRKKIKNLNKYINNKSEIKYKKNKNQKVIF